MLHKNSVYSPQEILKIIEQTTCCYQWMTQEIRASRTLIELADNDVICRLLPFNYEICKNSRLHLS